MKLKLLSPLYVTLVIGAAMSVSACSTTQKGTGLIKSGAQAAVHGGKSLADAPKRIKESRFLDIEFTSIPSGARVDVVSTKSKFEGGSCVTPCSLSLHKKGTYEAQISKDPYQRYRLTISPQDPAICDQSLFYGGLFGAIQEAAFKGEKILLPNMINVQLGLDGGRSFRLDENNNQVIDRSRFNDELDEKPVVEDFDDEGDELFFGSSLEAFDEEF